MENMELHFTETPCELRCTRCGTELAPENVEWECEAISDKSYPVCKECKECKEKRII